MPAGGPPKRYPFGSKPGLICVPAGGRSGRQRGRWRHPCPAAHRAYPDAVAIVLDLQHLHATLLDRDLDLCGTCVQAVLQHLLEGAGSALRAGGAEGAGGGASGLRCTSPRSLLRISALRADLDDLARGDAVHDSLVQAPDVRHLPTLSPRHLSCSL